MKKIETEQSPEATSSNPSALAPAGSWVDKSATLSQQRDEVAEHPKSPHMAVVQTTLGVSTTGKSDFEAVRGVSKDYGSPRPWALERRLPRRP